MQISRRSMMMGSAAAGVGWMLQPLGWPQGSAKFPFAEEQAKQFLKMSGVPGLSMAFLRGTRVLYAQGFGEAEPETHTPVQMDTLFRIASNSKAFTAAGIFLLIEAGKLKLDDKILTTDGVLKEYAGMGSKPEWLQAITVYHLLTHTAGGWGNSENDPEGQRFDLAGPEWIAWTLQTQPPEHAPGKAYAYSNFGYYLLGRVIERVSEQTYGVYMTQNVMARARIADMRLAEKAAAPHEAHYARGGGDPYALPIARHDANGGWIATPTDVAQFLGCLFSPQDKSGAPPIVSAQSLKTMTRGSAANPNYGCGLELSRTGDVFHSGSLPGTMSVMVHTQSGLAYAAMVNMRNRDAEHELGAMMRRIAHSVPGWNA